MPSQRDTPAETPLDESNSARPPADSSQHAPSAAPVSTTQRPVNAQPSSKSSASSTTSPRSSRTSSPARQSSTAAGSALSSPIQRTPPVTSFNRSASQVPSASAVHKALSGAAKTGLIMLEPATDASGKQQQSQPSYASEPGGLHWPTAPRLKSPPPSTSSRRNSSASVKQTETDSTESSLSNQTPDIQPQEQLSKPLLTHSEKAAAASKIARGASGMTSKLETVQEGDHPASPDERSSMLSQSAVNTERAPQEMVQHRSVQNLRSKDGANLDSSGDVLAQRSDNDGNKSDSAALDGPSTAPAGKRSVPSLTPNKVRSTNDGASKKMTVETETVSSIPQAITNAVAAERTAPGRVDSAASVKTKPSHETIRPKKEKRKAGRKTTSLASGTASSKADIFEAKVASAVDEDSTDSDETFVYESNPPEAKPRQGRHHSRTPSATSVQSTADRRGGARSAGPNDGQRAVTGKRSMKFASNTYQNSSVDDEPTDDNTPRSTTPRGDLRIATHTFRRDGNGNGNYGTTGEADSPFSSTSKHYKTSRHTTSRHSPRDNNPRATTSPHLRTPPSKSDVFPEDVDVEGERADDESVPLISSARSSRARVVKRPPTKLRHVDYYTDPPRGFCSRCVGCVVMVVTIAVVVFCAAGLIFATTKPLYDVRILDIQNILASEQEIMLDLLVQAVNPNILSVSVSDMDVNIFARSRYVGTDRFWRHHQDALSPSKNSTSASASSRDRSPPQSHARSRRWHWESPSEGSPFYPPPNYPPSDPRGPPIDDPESDLQTMLLGRIFQFDSGLTFEASPLRRNVVVSSGELRLQKPGNKTETGGTERWERVIQHPFELIVRGVLKYTLPLSGRVLKTTVGKAVVVTPDTAGNVDDLPPIKLPDMTSGYSSDTENVMAAPIAPVPNSRRSLGSVAGRIRVQVTVAAPL